MPIGDIFSILTALVWSVCVILMRVSGFHVRPVALTLFKSAASVPMFLVLILALGIPLAPALSAHDYARLMLSGVLGITIADTLFAAALNRLGASLQALADCIYSPTMAAVGLLLFGEHLGPAELVGGALVISGIAVGLRVTSEVRSRRDLWLGAALCAGSHLIMAFGILMVRDLLHDTSIIWISGFRFLTAAVALAAFAPLVVPVRDVFEGFRRRETWKTMLPMAFFGPFLATIFWTAGIKHLTAGRAAIYNQLSTAFIIILAALVLKEPMTARKLIGVALAAVGAVIVGMHQ